MGQPLSDESVNSTCSAFNGTIGTTHREDRHASRDSVHHLRVYAFGSSDGNLGESRSTTHANANRAPACNCADLCPSSYTQCTFIDVHNGDFRPSGCECCSVQCSDGSTNCADGSRLAS